MLQYPLIAPDHGADARLAKGDVFSGGVSVMCHINVKLIVPRERKLIVAFDRNGKYWRGGSAVTSAFQNTVCGWRTVALTDTRRGMVLAISRLPCSSICAISPMILTPKRLDINILSCRKNLISTHLS